MSVRHGLLALLADSPKYGYQLRATFEQQTGGTWPLNIGQVYTTLARLDRDGLVVATGDDGQGHNVYALTEAGHGEVARWFATPVARTDRPRDELAIKLSLALTVPGVDVRAVVQAQRTATLHDLQELTQLKMQAGDDDLAWLLVLDSLIFQAEAETRWLDSCEQRLVRHRRSPATRQPAVDVEGVRR
jgi:DNA-binding PadR family transcriptional regulator